MRVAKPRETVAAAVTPLLVRAARGALSERRFALSFWDGSEIPATVASPVGTVVLRDPRAVRFLLRASDETGLARAWVTGTIDFDGDLTRILALRRDLAGLALDWPDRLRALAVAVRVAPCALLRPSPPVEVEARLSGVLRSRHRDRAAITHHYDLPPNFYRLFLGPSMVYSCAYYAAEHDSLETAQQYKLELICRKLHLRPGERLLDIGCGWGALAVHAAVHHGVEVTGITLSAAQAKAARQHARERGVAGRCEFRVLDYRDASGSSYDAIASVGMYEHVGRSELGGYAERVRDLLRPGGRFLNHGITRLAAAPRRSQTLITRFVFPDGELHPLTDLLQALEQAGLELRDVESLREHYALTLRAWARNLEDNRAAAIACVGPQRERVWRAFVAGSADAFEHGELAIFQTLAVRPGAPHTLPLTRKHLVLAGGHATPPTDVPRSHTRDKPAEPGNEEQATA